MNYLFSTFLIFCLGNYGLSDIILDDQNDMMDFWEGSGFQYSDTYSEFEDGSDCGSGINWPMNIGEGDEEMNNGFWASCPWNSYYLQYNFNPLANLTSYPTSVYIRGYISLRTMDGSEDSILLTSYIGNTTLTQDFWSGDTWFEVKYPMVYPIPQIFFSIQNRGGFFMIDKIILETPETEEPVVICENSDYRCESVDQYGNEWIGCVGEILLKKCNPSSNAHATWYCSHYGEFATESPDYSQCSNEWLEIIKEGVDELDVVTEKKALEWIEIMDNKTLLALQTSAPEYYGHEIKTICNVAEDLFQKLDTNITLRVLEQITITAVEIFHRILINPNPWEEVNSTMHSAYRSVTGTAFLRTIQTSALTLIDRVVDEDFYQLSQFEELRVATGRVDKNTNIPLVFPSFPNENEAFIEIPATWTDFFPIKQTVGFVGAHISNNFAKRLFPKLLDNEKDNFQILGEQFTFTFEGDENIYFRGQGVKIHFKHQDPLLEFEKKSEVKTRRFPIPKARNITEIVRKCVYWDFRRNQWSEDGCKLIVADSNGTISICECQHLSSFAVLFDTNNIVSDEKALEILSWTLSIISIACLLLTVYAFSQSCVKSERSPKRSVTQHLALSLFAAHIGLLISIDTNNISPSVGFCTGIGAITHYAFLCSFAWMGWEGYVLYKSIFVVFQKNRESKWLKYSITYGLPALVVLFTGIVGIIKKESPYHSPTETDCWLSKDYIWAFIGPATIILLANLVLLIFSVRKAYQLTHKPQIAVNRQHQSFGKMVTGCTSLSVILGLTWLFGYLVLINDQSLAIAAAYIFTFLNASQGIFIFVFHVWTNPSIKKQLDRQLDKLNFNMSRGSNGFVTRQSTKQTY